LCYEVVPADCIRAFAHDSGTAAAFVKPERCMSVAALFAVAGVASVPNFLVAGFFLYFPLGVASLGELWFHDASSWLSPTFSAAA
jgi:hypothetical protein